MPTRRMARATLRRCAAHRGARQRDRRAGSSAPRVEPLRDGVRVVVAGPPNAGKSSLVNALAGQERAIVTAIPGTTRDHIEVPLAIDGVPIVLVDTAGLRDSDDAVEAIGVGRAAARVERADMLLWLGEPATRPTIRASIQVAAKARSRRPARRGPRACRR